MTRNSKIAAFALMSAIAIASGTMTGCTAAPATAQQPETKIEAAPQVEEQESMKAIRRTPAEPEPISEQDFEGSVAEDESEWFEMTLEPGTYEVIALSDSDDEDLDMRIWEGDDIVVEDDMTDNYPIVEFTLTRTSTIEIEVHAYTGEHIYAGVIEQIR